MLPSGPILRQAERADRAASSSALITNFLAPHLPSPAVRRYYSRPSRDRMPVLRGDGSAHRQCSSRSPVVSYDTVYRRICMPAALIRCARNVATSLRSQPASYTARKFQSEPFSLWRTSPWEASGISNGPIVSLRLSARGIHKSWCATLISCYLAIHPTASCA